jgi:hypothetical protein
MPKAGTGKSTFGNEARTSSRGARNTEPRTGNVKVTSPPSRRSSPDSDFIQRMRFLIQQAGVASLSSMSDPSVVPTSHPTYPEQGHFTALPRSCQDLSQGPQSRGRATVRNMLSGFSSVAAGANLCHGTLCVSFLSAGAGWCVRRMPRRLAAGQQAGLPRPQQRQIPGRRRPGRLCQRRPNFSGVDDSLIDGVTGDPQVCRPEPPQHSAPRTRGTSAAAPVRRVCCRKIVAAGPGRPFQQREDQDDDRAHERDEAYEHPPA